MKTRLDEVVEIYELKTCHPGDIASESRLAAAHVAYEKYRFHNILLQSYYKK